MSTLYYGDIVYLSTDSGLISSYSDAVGGKTSCSISTLNGLNPTFKTSCNVSNLAGSWCTYESQKTTSSSVYFQIRNSSGQVPATRTPITYTISDNAVITPALIMLYNPCLNSYFMTTAPESNCTVASPAGSATSAVIALYPGVGMFPSGPGYVFENKQYNLYINTATTQNPLGEKTNQSNNTVIAIVSDKDSGNFSFSLVPSAQQTCPIKPSPSPSPSPTPQPLSPSTSLSPISNLSPQSPSKTVFYEELALIILTFLGFGLLAIGIMEGNNIMIGIGVTLLIPSLGALLYVSGFF